MNYIETHARGSGRTYRAIEEAITQALKGRAVYFLCHRNGIGYTRDLALMICSKRRLDFDSLGIKFETTATLGERNICWRSRRIHGAHANCELIIDQHVYAEQFGFAIEGFHEYDGE